MTAGAQCESDSEPHFMGMLLYALDTESWQGAAQLNIIDGQQRMTTLSLLLCAFARHLDEIGDKVGGLASSDIFSRYLRIGDDAHASGKLMLSFMDRDTLYALVGAAAMPEEPATRLVENHELFYAKMGKEGFDTEQLWRGLNCLEVASILLDHDDSPQLVFESLNSKGMVLSTADRIRNLVVVSDEAIGRVEDGVFECNWLPLERLVESAGLELDVTSVVHAWLAGKYRGTRIFDASEAYGLFKSSLRNDYGDDLARALDDIGAFARKLINDDALRAKSFADAQRWIAGKPKELISEYKMFGD